MLNWRSIITVDSKQHEILSGLGKIYVADSEFKSNIDGYAGEDTAKFVSKAIEIYTKE